MVCDERGTTGWPSPSRTWAWGGFIIDARKQAAAIRVWEHIKHELCGDPSCELKWSHFFPGRHQERCTNPLLSDDPDQWRLQASWAIDKLFVIPGIWPVTSYVRKDEASNSIFKSSDDAPEKPHKVLDIDTLWITVYGQFALFLHQHRAGGEIWFDRLGSLAEEQRRQDHWHHLRNDPWQINPENQKLAQRISPHFKFLDSKANELVQMADFISGVIWAASEDDVGFLLRAFEKYFPTGPYTYMLARIK
jgi:hypothetical protein